MHINNRQKEANQKLELFPLKNEPLELKVALLKQFGYETDHEKVFIFKQGKPYLDPYSNKQVRVDMMAILPGSTIVIEDTPASIAAYMQEHRELD